MVNAKELSKGQQLWFVSNCSDWRIGGEDNLNYVPITVEDVIAENPSRSLLAGNQPEYITYSLLVGGVDFQGGGGYVYEKDLYYTEQEAKEAAINIVKGDIEWHTKQLNRRTDLLKRLGGVDG